VLDLQCAPTTKQHILNATGNETVTKPDPWPDFSGQGWLLQDKADIVDPSNIDTRITRLCSSGLHMRKL